MSTHKNPDTGTALITLHKRLLRVAVLCFSSVMALSPAIATDLDRNGALHRRRGGYFFTAPVPLARNLRAHA